MKKIALWVCLSVALSSLSAVYAQQTDCYAIVLPKFHYNEARVSQMPQEKLEWYCNFSRNSFFVCDTLPADAAVYDISELKSKQSGEKVSPDFVVDLNSLSYYAYDFDTYRYRHYGSSVYFRTPGSEHAYLAIRPYIEAMRLSNNHKSK
ncbi:MAG: hypothetical protein IJ764_05185 [Bacteroidales bacterium]|nr:hypothetical protein [Bacteroidales bacterium]